MSGAQALATRADTLAALETLAAGAQSELILATRCFAPDTPLVTDRLRDLGLMTWSDLIPWLTRRGVALFMAFGDDDPLLDVDRHRRAWLAASGFANVAQGDAQILCAPHGQQAGALWRFRLRGAVARARSGLRNDDARHLTLPQRAALAGNAPLRTQRINQSFMIADAERVVIGGFTLDARRAETLWHDVSLGLEDADFAGALRAHFADCWQAAMRTGAPALATAVRPFQSVSRRQSRPELRLIRTLSDPARGPFRLTGTPRANSFARQVARLLGSARESVYIETAALRAPHVASVLIDAAEACAGLQVVIVLHPGADRPPLGGIGRSAAHAQALQDRQLWRLAQALGSRLAVLSHGDPRPATALASGPAPLPGHIILVDDTHVVIGSHDLTPRALALDTEAAIQVRDPNLARDILAQRTALWQVSGDFSAAAWASAAALQVITPEPPPIGGSHLPDAIF